VHLPDLEGKKIDVVYPLTNTSKSRDDFELRYSLRSLNLQPWVKDLFIVGYRPPWVKNVHHIHSPDQWGYNLKDKNIIKKMLCACADSRVSDPFVANSDDQYWLKVVDPQDMLIPPRENPAQIDLERLNQRLNPYRVFRNIWIKRQYQTIEFLKKEGRSEIRFDGHCPYLIEKRKYMDTMAQVPWELGNGFLIVVYHGWNFESGNGFRIESRDGVLVRIKNDLKRNEIEEKTKQALFLNHNNRALTIGMREFLQKRFPLPSRWE